MFRQLWSFISNTGSELSVPYVLWIFSLDSQSFDFWFASWRISQGYVQRSDSKVVNCQIRFVTTLGPTILDSRPPKSRMQSAQFFIINHFINKTNVFITVLPDWNLQTGLTAKLKSSRMSQIFFHLNRTINDRNVPDFFYISHFLNEKAPERPNF